MGGDHAPGAVLGGMNQFLYQYGEDTVFFRVLKKKNTKNHIFLKNIKINTEKLIKKILNL